MRERIFLLLDATQTSLGGASGKFPQYYTAYYDLVVGTPRLSFNENLNFLLELYLMVADLDSWHVETRIGFIKYIM